MFVMIIDQPHYDQFAAIKDKKYGSDDYLVIGASQGQRGYLYCDKCERLR